MDVFDEKATRDALPFAALIEALAQLFKSGCTMPERQVLEILSAEGKMTSLIMAAWVEGRCYGVKTINIAPRNSALALPGLHSSYTLFDAVTGVPLAVIVADAYTVVRPIEQVTVWARDPSKAETLVEKLTAQGYRAALACHLEAAVREADIVSTATLATQPLIEGAWLKPGSHLDLIGSFTASMQEADPSCFSGAELYLDSEAALAKSGDLLAAAKAEGLVRGTAPARQHDRERTVFKSVGIALEDLAAAMLVAKR